MQRVKKVCQVSLAIMGLLGLAACSQSQTDQAAATPRIEEKSFDLMPAQATVKAGFLVGEFEGLRVSQRIEQGTGRVVEAPKLLGSLKLKNTSQDQAARPLAGHITYLNGAGQRINLAGGRGESTFTFPVYQDRLDPGGTTTARLDLPFPAAALGDMRLGEVQLTLSYIPIPIQEETMSVKVALSAKQ
jgi:hypothetical protein